jgi:hypothetical protein
VKALVRQYSYKIIAKRTNKKRGKADLLSTDAERKPLQIKRIGREDCTSSKKGEQYCCGKKASRKGSIGESKAVQK